MPGAAALAATDPDVEIWLLPRITRDQVEYHALLGDVANLRSRGEFTQRNVITAIDDFWVQRGYAYNLTPEDTVFWGPSRFDWAAQNFNTRGTDILPDGEFW
jgi:hypothetical protein